ncbi:MAG: hypothetical protein ABF876_05080 [Acetobacter aceti]
MSVHDFGVTVSLVKVGTGRSGGQQFQSLDLTPYLGDGGAIRTFKTVRDLEGGSFSITFSDRIAPGMKDSLYAYIAPMDMIEIRASRDAWKYVGQDLPLHMRGFVGRVRRIRNMDASGVPAIAVQIEGLDSAKLLNLNQLLFPFGGADLNEPFLEGFQLQAQYGLSSDNLLVGDFVRQMITKVINPKINNLSLISNGVIKPFTTDGVTVPEGCVSPIQTDAYHGSIAGLLSSVADRPWNEMYVEDVEAGPRLVFRPVPFRTATSTDPGALIMPGAIAPTLLELPPNRIIHMDLGRSDEGVANLFYVPPGALLLEGQFAPLVAWVNKVLDTSYANNLPDVFGLRMMQVNTALLPTGWAGQGAPALQESGAQSSAMALSDQWVTNRASQMKAMNRDNVVFESGTVDCLGSEDLKAGTEAHIPMGATSVRGYVPTVAHTIAPLRTWTTQLTIERATSYLTRPNVAGAPGWAEGRPGLYEINGTTSVTEAAGSIA